MTGFLAAKIPTAKIKSWGGRVRTGDHLAYFISDVVEQLELSAITRHYTHEERGYPPYHPVMMVKVLLYAYCVGVPSSHKIAKRLEEDIAFRIFITLKVKTQASIA